MKHYRVGRGPELMTLAEALALAPSTVSEAVYDDRDGRRVALLTMDRTRMAPTGLATDEERRACGEEPRQFCPHLPNPGCIYCQRNGTA